MNAMSKRTLKNYQRGADCIKILYITKHISDTIKKLHTIE